jgi:hypothetical protein
MTTQTMTTPIAVPDDGNVAANAHMIWYRQRSAGNKDAKQDKGSRTTSAGTPLYSSCMNACSERKKASLLGRFT